MKYLILLFLTFNTYSAQIKGRLNLTKNCQSKEAGQLFVSTKGQLVYQIEMPASGSFELNLSKGDYNFRFITKEGCSFNELVSVSDKNLVKEFKVAK